MNCSRCPSPAAGRFCGVAYCAPCWEAMRAKIARWSEPSELADAPVCTNRQELLGNRAPQARRTSPPTNTDAHAEIANLHEHGWSQRAIASRVGLSRARVRQVLARL